MRVLAFRLILLLLADHYTYIPSRIQYLASQKIRDTVRRGPGGRRKLSAKAKAEWRKQATMLARSTIETSHSLTAGSEASKALEMAFACWKSHVEGLSTCSGFYRVRISSDPLLENGYVLLRLRFLSLSLTILY